MTVCRISPAISALDQPGDQRLGFLVPMRFARLPRRVMHQRVGEGVGIFREIKAGGIEPVERIVA